jgi:hypothetical protein
LQEARKEKKSKKDKKHKKQWEPTEWH